MAGKASKPNLVAAHSNSPEGPHAVARCGLAPTIGRSVNPSMARRATARRAELARLF